MKDALNTPSFKLYVVCRKKSPAEQEKYGMFPNIMFFTDKWLNREDWGSMWRPKVTSEKFYRTKRGALNVISERGKGDSVYELNVWPYAEPVEVKK